MRIDQLTTLLRRSDSTQLDPTAHQRILSRLFVALRQVRSQPIPTVAPTHLFLRPSFLAPAAAGVFIVMVFGVAAAAETAKPGDALFPIERGFEQVRLSLSVSDEQRARLVTQFAEEREVEVEALEREESGQESHLPEAEDNANQALEQAIVTVTAVEQKQAQKGNTKASAALQKVRTRLTNISQRQAQKAKQRAEKKSVKEAQPKEEEQTPNGLTTAVATVNGQTALVKMVFNGQSSTFIVQGTTTVAVAAAISQRTGLTAAQVQSVLKFTEQDDGLERQSSDDTPVSAESASRTEAKVELDNSVR